jgi:hypothetical protein
MVLDLHLIELSGIEHSREIVGSRQVIVGNRTADETVHVAGFLRRSEVDDVKPSLWLEDALNLAEGELLIGEMREGREGSGDVEDGISEGQRQHVGIDDMHIIEREVAVRLTSHFEGKIDAGHAPGRTDTAAEEVKENAGAAAEVDDMHPRPDRETRDKVGEAFEILAGELKVPFFGEAIEKILMGIVHRWVM